MRSRLLVLLALLAACSEPLPPGVERVDGASSAQGFAWSPAARRLAFVEGRFPGRTYLVIRDRASGARTRRRLKGFVLGDAVALSRDGRRVLFDAGKVGLGTSDEPSERVVLVVDADSGAVLLEQPIGAAGAAALGHPAWSPDPIAAWNVEEGLQWLALGSTAPAGGFLKGPGAWRALLLDEPYLVVAERQTERPRMTVYDLRNNRPVAEWRVALSAAPLALRPDGTALSARWMSETGTFVLESGDPRTSRRVPLLEAEGEIETALETADGLYAVAKDVSRRDAAGKDFLAPRVLLVVERGGRRWSAPWTSHRGEFIGADPKDGKLLFAVTNEDKPGAWAIAPTREALSAAGAAIDGAD